VAVKHGKNTEKIPSKNKGLVKLNRNEDIMKVFACRLENIETIFLSADLIEIVNLLTADYADPSFHPSHENASEDKR
jgi:hypothetical protein